MRTDYVLYVIAVICFIVAGLTAVHPYAAASNTLIAIVLAIIGLIFIVGGYSMRPQTRVTTRIEPAIPQTKPAMEEPSTPPPPVTKPSPEPEPTPAPEEMPSQEAPEETKKEEVATPEVPEETKTEVKTETKKPVRKRRERKEA